MRWRVVRWPCSSQTGLLLVPIPEFVELWRELLLWGTVACVEVSLLLNIIPCATGIPLTALRSMAVVDISDSRIVPIRVRR